MYVVRDPRGCRELGARGEGPVGDQGEQHPFHHRVPAGAGGQAAQQGADPQPRPELVEQPRPAQRSGLGAHQPRHPPGPHPVRAAARPDGRLGAEYPGQRGDQPLDRGPVKLVSPAEGVQHLRPGRLRRRVPLVVDQLQVGHPCPVAVLPGRSAHEHVTRPYTSLRSSKAQPCPIRVTRTFGPSNQVPRR